MTEQEPTFRRQEIYDDLVGVSEIAKLLGVSIYRVKRWIEFRESTGSPAPVRTLGLGHIYSLTEWRGWWALWRVTRGYQWPDRLKDRQQGL